MDFESFTLSKEEMAGKNNYPEEEEELFIKEHNQLTDALMMLAFVDGEYAGNCSFESKAEAEG